MRCAAWFCRAIETSLRTSPTAQSVVTGAGKFAHSELAASAMLPEKELVKVYVMHTLERGGAVANARLIYDDGSEGYTVCSPDEALVLYPPENPAVEYLTKLCHPGRRQ